MIESTHVGLAQVLCPSRHAQHAVLFEPFAGARPDQQIAAAMNQDIHLRIRRGDLAKECEFCGQPVTSWMVIIGDLPFRSLRDAMPAFRAYEAGHNQWRATMRLLGLTHKGPQRYVRGHG